MRKVGMILLLLFIMTFILPLIFLKGCNTVTPKQQTVEKETYSLNVYVKDKGCIVKMGLEEYVLGVVAGEMPESFQPEALKAQALAARTYTVLRMKAFGGNGCSAHPGADVCTDPKHCQAYRDPKTLKKNYEKVKKAVYDTNGEVIVYKDQLIDAVFHSTSGGKTENSEDVWSSSIPYLRSVLSQYEDASPKLVTQKEMTVTSFISQMKKLAPDLVLSKKNIRNEIHVMQRSDGGRIMKIKVGNKVFKGTELRDQLELNSTNFSIAYGSNKMIFTVTGYGHGIGMSQYGADGMASNGADYLEIIKHYYQGVDVVPLDTLK